MAYPNQHCYFGEILSFGKAKNNELNRRVHRIADQDGVGG
jgi:hypothetical protein